MPSAAREDAPGRGRPSAGLVLGLCGVGALVLGSYEIARPAADSMYLSVFGKDGLPLVWLAVAAGAVATVWVYNRVAASMELSTLFTWVCAVTGAALVALQGLRAVAPGPAVFLLYVWKDLYIVFLVEMFWTFANNVFRLQSARWLYGLFLAAGTLGALAGSQLVGTLAVTTGVGTAASLWAVLPVLAAAVAVVALLRPSLGRAVTRPERPAVRWREAFAVMADNRLLTLLAALIGASQVVITLVDYQYNGAIAAHAPDEDLRTRLMSQVNMAINGGALAFQLGAGPILRWAGTRWVLLGIPTVLGAALGGWVALPGIAMIVVAKVGSKAFDYSIFRTAKELLYLPLSYAEKTQGKAVVDILSYRVSKAGAAFLLLALVAAEATGLALVLTAGALVAWIGVSWALVKPAPREATVERPATTRVQ